MIHLILFQPQIPQNTRNVGRLCAYVGCRLHLIKPYGFEIDDKHLRRAGMDYWRSLDLREHDDWQGFLSSSDCPQRIHLFSTHAEREMWDASFEDGDGLLFGNEGAGLPSEIHEWGRGRRVKIPQFADGLRSLNLSSAAAVAVYEAFRQIRS